VLLASFAGIAVFLALAGLYGLLSFAVKQRTAEIGVRMALGASPGAILGMIVQYGLTLTAAGLAIGLVTAFAVTRWIGSLLYGVHAADPLTFIAVPIFILGVAIVACLVPASKAARIDPVEALRCQ
jgi:ABC-type antimicrobial peptide transport system permease subunit